MSLAAELPPHALVHGWEAVKDEDLQRAFGILSNNNASPVGSLYTRRCLAKRGLRMLVSGDPERRWPIFWTHGRYQRQTTQCEISVGNAIPYRVFRQGPQGPMWTVFDRLTRPRLRSSFQFDRTEPSYLTDAPTLRDAPSQYHAKGVRTRNQPTNSRLTERNEG